MKQKAIRIYILSAGLVLLAVAIAKFISSEGSATILQKQDPILMLSFQHVFWLIGAIELAVAFTCFFSKQVSFQAGLLAWLATSFIVYRLGLLWIGYHKPCPCLGNLTDALHISPHTAGIALKISLAYLLIGSYVTIFWLWRQRKNATSLPAEKINVC